MTRSMILKGGRVTPCAPRLAAARNGARGATRPTSFRFTIPVRVQFWMSKLSALRFVRSPREKSHRMNLASNWMGPRRASSPRPAAHDGLTLIELLVVVAILALLSAILLPALGGAKHAAQQARCVSHVRQLGLAATMYFDDHEGRTFPYQLQATNRGVIYWFGGLQNGAEGERAFDATLGPLYEYMLGRGIELCPSFRHSGPRFKLKANGATFGYGVNRHITSAPGLRSFNIGQIRDAASIVLFADAAQINDFQAPASPENPLLEEWYYVDAGGAFDYPNAHFRHQQRANAVFADGHVGRELPEAGSIDSRLPREHVGRLRREILEP